MHFGFRRMYFRSVLEHIYVILEAEAANMKAHVGIIPNNANKPIYNS
jgi:hypothetical protein